MVDNRADLCEDFTAVFWRCCRNAGGSSSLYFRTQIVKYSGITQYQKNLQPAKVLGGPYNLANIAPSAFLDGGLRIWLDGQEKI